MKYGHIKQGIRNWCAFLVEKEFGHRKNLNILSFPSIEGTIFPNSFENKLKKHHSSWNFVGLEENKYWARKLHSLYHSFIYSFTDLKYFKTFNTSRLRRIFDPSSFDVIWLDWYGGWNIQNKASITEMFKNKVISINSLLFLTICLNPRILTQKTFKKLGQYDSPEWYALSFDLEINKIASKYGYNVELKDFKHYSNQDINPNAKLMVILSLKVKQMEIK